ncbi:MAG: hypothetical protein RR553_03655 [Akkermansia sp.]
MSVLAPKNAPFPQKKWRQYASDKSPQVWRPLKDALNQCNTRVHHISHCAQFSSEYWDPSWGEYGINISPIARWVRRFIGVAILLPVAIISSMALIDQLSATGTDTEVWLSIPVWYTLMGCLVWVILGASKLFTHTLLYLYVLGHELTHAIAVILSFGKVSNIKVTVDGGEVQTSKSNLFIALSPYFIPLWALVWAGLYTLINLFYSLDHLQPLLYGGIGFWWAFHLFWTGWIIPKDQPDLKENGTFFSLMIVYLSNQILLIGILMICNIFVASKFCNDFYKNAQALVESIRDFLHWGYQLFL